jgi:hypothetical protein
LAAFRAGARFVVIVAAACATNGRSHKAPT